MKIQLHALVLFVILGFMPIFGYCQIQIGEDIDGEVANDNSGYGVSISSNGNIVAVSAKNNEGVNGIDSGHVRVLENINGTWTQIGQDIDGDVEGYKSGYGMAFSKNGNIVSIGAYRNDTGAHDAGQVRVFEFNGVDWVQMGQSIYGHTNSDYFGRYISLSHDGHTMALSFRPFSSTGFVSVFQFNGSNWLQIGGAIAGEGFNDSFGVSHALSFDGSILAIGAHKNDGLNGIDSGHVKVFENMDDVWNQIGQDIDGEAPGGNIGYDAHFGGAIGGNKQRI